jgi:hypothetical protein
MTPYRRRIEALKSEVRGLHTRQRVARAELDRLLSRCDHRHRRGRETCPDCGMPEWCATGFDPILDADD